MKVECVDCKAERERRGQGPPKVLRKTDGAARKPRCATHKRQLARATKDNTHDRRVQRVYGLGPGDYSRMYMLQGQHCALCQRATGATKNLAVDHDHMTGLAYGLLCGPCNKDVMGHSRRSVAYFQRCIDYLLNPPARQLGIVAIHEDKRKESDGPES